MFSYGGYGLSYEDNSSAVYCSGFETNYRGLLFQCIEDISVDPKKLENLHSLVDDFIKDHVVINSKEILLYDAAFHCIDQDDGDLLLKVIQLTSKVQNVYSFKFDYYRYINISNSKNPPDYSQSLLLYASKNNKFNCIKVLLDNHNYFIQRDISKDIFTLSFIEVLKNDNDVLIKYFVEFIMYRKREYGISYINNRLNILQAAYSTRYRYEMELVLKEIDWSTKCSRDPWYRKHLKYIVPIDSFDLVFQQFEETEKDYTLLLLKEYLPIPFDIVKFVIRKYL
jgi:hypothetical protein